MVFTVLSTVVVVCRCLLPRLNSLRVNIVIGDMSNQVVQWFIFYNFLKFSNIFWTGTLHLYQQRSCEPAKNDKPTGSKHKWIPTFSVSVLKLLGLFISVLFKGQLISKWFFGVVDFLQKTKTKTLIWGIIIINSNSFVHFFEEIDDPPKPFRD